MSKPHLFKCRQDGKWVVKFPPFGLSSDCYEEDFDTFKQAVNWLVGVGNRLASSSSSMERTHTPGAGGTQDYRYGQRWPIIHR